MYCEPGVYSNSFILQSQNMYSSFYLLYPFYNNLTISKCSFIKLAVYSHDEELHLDTSVICAQC